MIWDTKSSKFLLNSGPISLQYPKPPHLSGAVFSSDGHFFIYLTSEREVYVWKKSLTCYVLHQKLTISGNGMSTTPFISSSGRSFIVFIDSISHLCHTEHQIISSTHTEYVFPFNLGFSPQNQWAAFGQFRENTVTVLHLQSGDPQLVIDPGICVEHLRLTESAIVVAGGKKVATYNLPASNSTFNTRMDVGDSVQAITLKNDSKLLSISPNLNYVACKAKGSGDCLLEIYELSTGKHIVYAIGLPYITRAWFTPDGHIVWVECEGPPASGWKIIQGSKSGVTKLEPLEQHVSPPRGPHWESSTYGYQIVDDVWVLSPTQRRLLWLPPQWRTYEDCRVWNGNFLGLKHPKPREVVILEFLE